MWSSALLSLASSLDDMPMPKTNGTKIANDLVGASGVHYVASELSFRGMLALPTIKNTPGYDLIVTSRNGKKHANIQVKTSQNSKTRFWPMPWPDKVCAGSGDYYVLLRRNGASFDAFMLTGREARKEVEARLKEETKSIALGTRKVGFACVWVDRKGLEAKKAKWARRWKNFRLS